MFKPGLRYQYQPGLVGFSRVQDMMRRSFDICFGEDTDPAPTRQASYCRPRLLSSWHEAEAG
jgi:hypothetical protein